MIRILPDTSCLNDIRKRQGSFQEPWFQVLVSIRTENYVNAVSIWEMRLKYGVRHRFGVRKSPFSPEDVVNVLEDQEVSFLHMTTRHAARALGTALDHKAPFDELLLVEAQEEGLRLLTVDRRLLGHPLAVAANQLG